MNKIPFERLVEIAEGNSSLTASEELFLSRDADTASELEELRDLFDKTRGLEVASEAFINMDDILPNVMQAIEEKKRFSILEFLPSARPLLGMAASITAVLVLYLALMASAPSLEGQPFGYLANLGEGADEIIYPYSSMELMASAAENSDFNLSALADAGTDNLENYQFLTLESDYSIYDDISTLEDDKFDSLIDELEEK